MKEKLKKVWINTLIMLFFCAMYLILTQDFSIGSIVVGLVVSFASITITNLFICDINYHNIFKINIFSLIGYSPFLLYKIVSSGINTIAFIVKNNATCNFFYYKSNLDSDFKLNLLSNSITLTPGTVTVDRQGSILLIMQMCKKDEACHDSDIIKMEKRIDKI